MNRRQQFLTQPHYESVKQYFEEEELYWDTHSIQAETPLQEAYLKARRISEAAFQSLLLRYTAGEEIACLEPLLEKVISKYEQMQSALANAEQTPNISPLNIDGWPDEYEEAVQIIGFCVLLHRGDLVRRFIKLLDAAGYAGEDLLVEDLARKYLPNRADIDEWFHERYTFLVQSIYESTPEEASELLDSYCKAWYPEFSNASWHDSHKDEEGTYFGYWAIEAGAIAYLYNIDDTKITHMVYPKDLVAYAKNHNTKETSGNSAKVYAGQQCTRSGFWYAPAQKNSLRFFNHGEVMPEFKGSPWGATIWYWSGDDE